VRLIPVDPDLPEADLLRQIVDDALDAVDLVRVRVRVRVRLSYVWGSGSAIRLSMFTSASCMRVAIST